MSSVLRATALLGSSSLVSIVVGLVSAKAWAVLLGPSGLGFMGLMLSLVGLAGMVAGMGVGTGLVRFGAGALAEDDARRVAGLRRASWMLMWGLGGLAVLVLVAWREAIARLMLDGPEHGGSVVLMGVALLFTLAAGLQTNTLNAYHRVGALAKIGVLNSVVGTVVSLALVWAFGETAIAWAIIASAAASWGVTRYYVNRQVAPPGVRPTRGDVVAAGSTLLRFGAPFMGSMLVGTGVQLALPVLVLHALGQENVGYFRAAAAISVSYLGFLLAAMAQDYYPRVSAVGGQPGALVALANQQHRLVLLLGAPMILGVLALAPVLVPLVYAPEFQPAAAVLEWQLVADVLKFSSWTMAFVVLARSGSGTYFVSELVMGVALLLASWLGMRWFGLRGLGLGFLAAYAVYYPVVWFIVRREIGLVWSAENRILLVGTLAAALVVPLLPAVGLGSVRTPVALLLAATAGLVSARLLWRDVGLGSLGWSAAALRRARTP